MLAHKEPLTVQRFRIGLRVLEEPLVGCRERVFRVIAVCILIFHRQRDSAVIASNATDQEVQPNSRFSVGVGEF